MNQNYSASYYVDRNVFPVRDSGRMGAAKMRPSHSQVAAGSPEKYQLRPRALRGRSEPRQRKTPAPLSKYRRKTANARERSRMREINRAFETLRRAVPTSNAPGNPGEPAPCEKLTKITTLRQAMRYIRALTAALSDCKYPDSDFGVEFPSCEDLGVADYGCQSPDSWSSPMCSELSLSPELSLAREVDEFSSDFAEDSLSPFDSFLAEFNYVEGPYT